MERGIDLKGYIKIINGNGFDIFFNIINNVDILNRGIGFYMKKDKDGNISEEKYKEQFLEMYNAIFNNNSNKEYDNDEITLGKYYLIHWNILGKYSYEFIMESISLLKKGLKY